MKFTDFIPIPLIVAILLVIAIYIVFFSQSDFGDKYYPKNYSINFCNNLSLDYYNFEIEYFGNYEIHSISSIYCKAKENVGDNFTLIYRFERELP